MIPEDDLSVGQLRLLDVDNRVVIPVTLHVRLIITSADVLHSWAVPSLGIKCNNRKLYQPSKRKSDFKGYQVSTPSGQPNEHHNPKWLGLADSNLCPRLLRSEQDIWNARGFQDKSMGEAKQIVDYSYLELCTR